VIYAGCMRTFVPIVLAPLVLAPLLLGGCATGSTPTTSITASPSSDRPAPASSATSAPAGTTESLLVATPTPSSSDPIDVNAGSPYVSIDCLNGRVTPGKTAPQGPELGGVWAQLASDSAPDITVREGAPNVASVATLDLAEGSGAMVKATDTVTMDYCGVGLATRTAFDSSWVHGGALPIPLAKVIPGWRDAITGMRVGGTRLMLIPAEQAFGSNPPKGSGISPDETIAFVVTVQATGA